MHKYKLGDKYRSDFDHKGMIDMGLKSDISWGYDKLYKLHTSLEDLNYHSESKYLWDALTALKAGKNEEAKKYLLGFQDALKEEYMEEYVMGTTIKGMKKYYLAWSSWFDSNQYDIEKITNALKSIGAIDIHLESEGGKFNQPEVVVFKYKGSNEEPLRAIGEVLNTKWLYVYPVDWKVKFEDGGGLELTAKEKLQKLGIKFTSEFGDKNRALLDKINKQNEGGEYVGYQLNVNKNQLIVIGKKGTIEINITDYDKFEKGLIGVSAKAVHYKKGGNTLKNFDYQIGGL